MQNSTEKKPLTFRRLEDKIVHKDKNSDPAVRQMFYDLRKFFNSPDSPLYHKYISRPPLFPTEHDEINVWRDTPLYKREIEVALLRFYDCHRFSGAKSSERVKALLFILTRASQINVQSGKDPLFENIIDRLNRNLTPRNSKFKQGEPNGNE